MLISLSLTEAQATVLQDTLTTSLQSIVYQEMTLKNELDSLLKNAYMSTNDQKRMEEIANVQKYLATVAPQRVLLAEIIHTIQEARDKTIITHL